MKVISVCIVGLPKSVDKDFLFTVQPHSDMGQHRTLGGVFWNLLISVACCSNGP
jgi:hypothetical protein